MKKLLSLLLCVFLLTATLTACGNDTDSTNTEDKKHNSDAVIIESKSTQEDRPTNVAPTADHYEGDGHDHSRPTASSESADAPTATTPETAEKVKYQIYTNADKTYHLVFRDTAGKMIAEFDNIPKTPILESINTEQGIYALGWASGSGPNDFECVYYDVKTGKVSKQFHAPRGTDGVRIAYGSEDQTKIIVTDVFSSGSYYKEYPLENAYTDAKDIIIGGNLKVDKKTVVIAYVTDAEGATQHTMIGLYE